MFWNINEVINGRGKDDLVCFTIKITFVSGKEEWSEYIGQIGKPVTFKNVLSSITPFNI